MNKNTQKPKKKHWIFRLMLGGIFVKIFSCLFKRRKDISCNLKDFVKEEEREIKEFRAGQENFKKYCHDSLGLFCDYFIPSYDNGHKPKILRPRSLAIITASAVAIKVIVVAYLFLVYPNQAMMSDVVVKRVFELTNQSRQENGVGTLVMNSVLSASAKNKASDMIANNYFAHYSPTNVSPWDWINRADYPYIFVGENLAMNFVTADAVHKALMNSPSHKKNILNKRYTDMGLAMLSGKIDGQNTNVLVELFGTTGSSVSGASAVVKEPTKTVTTTVAKTETPVETITKTEIPVKTVAKTETTKPVEVKHEVSPVVEKKVETVKEVQSTQVASSRREVEAKTQPEPVQAQVEKVKETDNFIDESAEYDLNTKVVYMSPEENRRFGIATSLVRGSHYFYMGLLMMMIAIFMVNILVRFTVQHRPVIFQTLFVILFIFSLASVKIHFMESIINQIALL